MDSSTTNSPSKILARVHTFYTLRVPPSCCRFQLRPLPARCGPHGFSDTGSRFIIIRRSALPLGWQCHVCSEDKISPAGNASESFLHILSVINLWIRFESDVYKKIFSIADYYSVEVVTGTWFMSRPFNSICCMEQQVELTKVKIPLFGSASNISMVKGLECMADYYSGPATDTSTKKTDGLLSLHHAS